MRRILDFSGATSQEVFRLRVDKGCLLVAHGQDEEASEVRITLPEVGVLVLGHRLALTGAVLGHVTAHGGVVLALDDRYRPCGLMLPLEGNRAHAARLRWQIQRTADVAPQCWQQIVRAKVALQAAMVPQAGLMAWSVRVRPGDPDNIEAVVARAYFSALFGDGFRRTDENDTNAALNYGYAVLRSLVARSVCAAGLHPALGLHHRSSPFALADDLMEPARPAMDAAVSKLEGPLTPASKRAILATLLTPVQMTSGLLKWIEVSDAIVQSLVRVLQTGQGELDLPLGPALGPVNP